MNTCQRCNALFDSNESGKWVICQNCFDAMIDDIDSDMIRIYQYIIDNGDLEMKTRAIRIMMEYKNGTL